mgnify:CR=1 FL=1
MTASKWIAGIGIGAAAIAIGLYSYGAKAADLGGDCCADLESRIAELEVSTARKGNRKVRLTISGIIHKGLLSHNNDDLPGANKLSIYDGTTDPSRVRIEGEGKMSGEWAAGFVFEFAFAGNTARGLDIGKAMFAVDGPDGKNEFQIGETGTTVRHSYVYLSGPIGKFSLGQQSTATDGIIEINLSQSNLAGRALQTMPLNFGGALAGLATPFDGTRANAVRYDTPVLAGFTGTVAWQDNDSWDAALRYAQEFGQIRLAAGIGYRDQKSQTLVNVVNLLDVVTFNVAGSHKSVAGSASIQHIPTGVYANVYGSQVKYDLTGELAILPPLFTMSFDLGRETAKGMGAQVGIEKNWFGVGASTIFVDWSKVDGQMLVGDYKSYGIGAIQSFDALATSVYLTAKRLDISETGCLAVCKDTDVVMGGVRISY